MTRSIARSLLLSIVCAAFIPVAGAATINVRVSNASGAAVDNAVVYAVPSKPMPLAKNTAVMDQVNRTFVPHVLPIQTGTWVEFPNSDQILHQIFSISPIRRFNSPLYVGKPPRPIQFPAPGVAEVGCTIHEEMSGFIVVVDTPFFGTTSKAGRAALTGVVPGEYLLRVWYEGMKGEPKAQTIAVRDEEDVNASIVTTAK